MAPAASAHPEPPWRCRTGWAPLLARALPRAGGSNQWPGSAQPPRSPPPLGTARPDIRSWEPPAKLSAHSAFLYATTCPLFSTRSDRVAAHGKPEFEGRGPACLSCAAPQGAQQGGPAPLPGTEISATSPRPTPRSTIEARGTRPAGGRGRACAAKAVRDGAQPRKKWPCHPRRADAASVRPGETLVSHARAQRRPLRRIRRRLEIVLLVERLVNLPRHLRRPRPEHGAIAAQHHHDHQLRVLDPQVRREQPEARAIAAAGSGLA